MRVVPFAFRLAAALIAFGATFAKADDFYRGKTLSIIVGSTPGGSFDLISRAMSRYFGSYLPGKPAVVVQNMPGAGSMTALGYIDSLALADGSVFGTFLPGIVTQSIVTPEKIRANMSKIAWVGVVSADYSRVCYGYGPRGVASMQELIDRRPDQPFIMGTTGTGASNYINGMSLREVFGAPLKIIMGFPGSSEIRLAIERGELDGDCGGLASIPRAWIDQGKAHVFVRFAERRIAGMPESAAYVGDFIRKDEDRQYLNLLYAGDQLGRPYVAPKKTPADRLALLRAAFNRTMTDPGFITEMEKVQEAIYPVTGEQAEAMIDAMKRIKPDILARARKIYE
jgi:tripartite-type tricarboxylate transporter receptor subunit TctC